jgi:hypothetical protein
VNFSFNVATFNVLAFDAAAGANEPAPMPPTGSMITVLGKLTGGLISDANQLTVLGPS